MNIAMHLLFVLMCGIAVLCESRSTETAMFSEEAQFRFAMDINVTISTVVSIPFLIDSDLMLTFECVTINETAQTNKYLFDSFAGQY